MSGSYSQRLNEAIGDPLQYFLWLYILALFLFGGLVAYNEVIVG